MILCCLSFSGREKGKEKIIKSQKVHQGVRCPQGVPDPGQASLGMEGTDPGESWGKMEREADVCPGHLGRLGCLATSEHKDPTAPRPWGWNSSATWCPRGGCCPRLHRRQRLASSIPVAGSSPRWANRGHGRLGWARPPRAPGTALAVPGPQHQSLDSVADVQVALTALSPAPWHRVLTTCGI